MYHIDLQIELMYMESDNLIKNIRRQYFKVLLTLYVGKILDALNFI